MKPILFIKEDKGVTLIETIIAILLAAMTFVGFLQACNISAQMLENMKYRMSAVNIAQAQIEYLKAQGYDNIKVSSYTPFKSTNVTIDYGPTTAPEDDVIGEMRTKVRRATLAPTNGKKIVVEVIWPILGESKSEVLETVIYDRN